MNFLPGSNPKVRGLLFLPGCPPHNWPLSNRVLTAWPRLWFSPARRVSAGASARPSPQLYTPNPENNAGERPDITTRSTSASHGSQVPPVPPNGVRRIQSPDGGVVRVSTFQPMLTNRIFRLVRDLRPTRGSRTTSLPSAPHRKCRAVWSGDRPARRAARPRPGTCGAFRGPR